MSDQVLVAIIGALGAIAVGWITRAEIRRRVGTPNGRGNLTEMAERTDARLERVETLAGELLEGQARIVGSQAGQDRRLAVLERDRPPWWISWAPAAIAVGLIYIRRRSKA